jgi:pyruvate dehydrogenase E1 component beta subunit
MIREAQKAIAMAKQNGFSVELIDLRSIWPIDRDTVRESVRITGRVLNRYGSSAELWPGR